MAFVDAAGESPLGQLGSALPPPPLPALGAPPAAAAAAAKPPEMTEQHRRLMEWSDPTKTPNIAKHIKEDELGKIGQRVVREYQIDVESRSEWITKSKEAMRVAMQITEEKSSPWPDASNVIYPLMTTASIQFASRAYPAIVAGRNVVKGVVIGDDSGLIKRAEDGTPALDARSMNPIMLVEPGEKRKRADRIAEHMSWQLLKEQDEWEPDTDLMLHVLPIVGCTFRKSYFDPAHGRNCSSMVRAESLVINYRAKSMKSAPRITEELMLYPLEVQEAIRSGIFLEHQLGPTESGNSQDDDAPREYLEQHRWLDLDDDEFPEPYVVTVQKRTSKVVRIVARYDAEGIRISARTNDIVKIEAIHYYTKYDFIPNPDGGIYGIGFGQLLLPINDAIDSTLNMLIDAGHLSVTGGGFIGKGVSMSAGSVRFRPGEWKPVNTPGQTMREAMVQLEFPGPSTVLFSLLGLLIEAGEKIAVVKDVLSGEINAATMQPTTLLALIEQGLKVFTGIYKRIHRSLAEEFSKLYRLNRVYMEDIAEYAVGDDWKQVEKKDYEAGAGVLPISDPEMVSDMQKMARAQFLLAFKDDPRVVGVEAIRRGFEAASIPGLDKLIVDEPPAPDPIMLATLAEMEVKAGTDRAKQIESIAHAVLYMAQAEKAGGDKDLGWISSQLEILRMRFEMLNGQGGQQGGPPADEALAAPGAGADSAAGAEGGEGEQPPVPGARKAPDGAWYVPDESRPGKYLQVAMQ